ncbi:MAG: hypothetical protein HQK65_06530 [Desulfamplus sp.]|nr:hypothetical protein [Desulfamplus sp.]
MKKLILGLMVLLISLSVSNVIANTPLNADNVIIKDNIPEGWDKGEIGTKNKYEVGIDTKIFRSAPDSYFIKSIANDIEKEGYCMLWHIMDKKYFGKRVKISVHLKAEGMVSSAFLFLMTPKSEPSRHWKGISKDTDWQEISLVMDIPLAESRVEYSCYGISLWNKGQVWIDDLKIEVVDGNTPLDSMH